MGAIAPIKLTKLSANSGYITNSATVGTDTTFDPERFLAGGIAKWVDRSGGISLGYRSLTMQLRPPTKDSRVNKLTVKLLSPVLETVDPATGIFGPKLGYTLSSLTDHIIPERATAQEKMDHFNLYRSLYFGTIAANDGTPSDSTGSPIQNAMTLQEDVY
jgi:hypothetical protein